MSSVMKNRANTTDLDRARRRSLVGARFVGLMALLASAAAGCSGDPALVAGDGAPLFTAAAPLPIASEGALDAPDCMGLIGDGSQLRFEVASLQGGLVAVVDGSGAVVCVDTVSDVQSDLDAAGAEDTAAALVAGFSAAVHAAEAQDAMLFRSGTRGDPEPQPNTRPVLGDPEPQPN